MSGAANLLAAAQAVQQLPPATVAKAYVEEKATSLRLRDELNELKRDYNQLLAERPVCRRFHIWGL